MLVSSGRASETSLQKGWPASESTEGWWETDSESYRIAGACFIVYFALKVFLGELYFILELNFPQCGN